MRLLRLVLAALVGALSLILLGSGTSYACSCAMASTAEHVARADIVVDATVVDVVPPPQDGTWSSVDPVTYELEVTEVFKGEATPTLELRSPVSGASCGLEGIRPGRRYVFFAGHTTALGKHVQRMHASLCGGTAPAAAGLVGEVEAVTGAGVPPVTMDPIPGTAYESTLVLAGDEPTEETTGGDWALPLALVAGGGLTLLTVGLWVRYVAR